MKVVLSPNPYRDRGLKTARAAERVLRGVGVDCVVCLPFSMDNLNAELPKQVVLKEMGEELKDADMLICFGGDGTILHAAKNAYPFSVPVLGVNLGTMGFMADLEQNELSLLSRVAEGKYTLERRMMLDVVVMRDGREVFRELAFNDAAITKGAVARMVELEIFADGKRMSGVYADGVVVSTPTGSTAYSMSAGGPIVEPTAENIIVTPICPHALTARSFVLSQARQVLVKLKKGSRRTAYLSVDGGRAFQLSARDSIELRRSKSKTQLVRVVDRSFYEILYQKLGRL